MCQPCKFWKRHSNVGILCRDDPVILDVQPLSVAVQKICRIVQKMTLGIFSSQLDRTARDECLAAGGTCQRVRRCDSICADDADIVIGNAKRLCCDLAERRIGALSNVTGTGKNGDRAIIRDLDGRRRMIRAVEAIAHAVLIAANAASALFHTVISSL